MTSYDDKVAARKARLQARAEALKTTGEAKIESGMSRLRQIPFGQPILVGHHSEKRDRNFRAKAGASIDRGMETLKVAEDVARRAAAVGTGGISSDDPAAVTKLKEKLAGLQARQEMMKQINAAWRKAGKPKAVDNDGWAKVTNLLTSFTEIPTEVFERVCADARRWMMGLAGYEKPPYTFELTNNGGNMKRIEQRIALLERNAARETTEEVKEVAGLDVRMVENAEANRLQLFFPGKPSAPVRMALKAAGFRWAPSEGAWQLHLSNAAKWKANNLLERMAKGELK